MTSSTRTSNVSPGTIISVLSIFLYCAGFVRVEWKLHEQNSRITTLESKRASEDHLVHDDGEKGDWQYNLHLIHLIRKRRDKNSADNSTDSLESLLKQLLKKIKTDRCPIRAHSCFRGAPGRPGSKGDKGPRGRRGPKGKMGRRGAGRQGPRGRTGKQGMMGPAGRKGDKGNVGPQGIMGPPGIKGEKGEKGLQGLSGLKGDPGKSISVPVVVISPPSQTVNENSIVILHCSATGNPKPIIKWTKINGVLPVNRYEVNPSSGQLKLKQVHLGDAGEFQCEARNILGVSRAKSSLVVHVPPQISLKPGPTYAEENKLASLPKCHATGNPPPKITWYKVLGQLPAGRSSSNNGSLSLQRVQKSDSGHYTCRASNLLGTQAAHTQLVVVSPPQFVVRPPSTVDVFVGQTLQINCSARGDPRPLVTWRRVGGQLPHGRSAVVNGNLVLRRVKTIDSGTYICRATYISILKGQEATVTVNIKECSQAPAVGAASGGRLPDSSFTASSNAGSGYLAKYGRLNHLPYAWCQKSSAISPYEYLQVDLGAAHQVCAVATQGIRGSGICTTKYKLKISNDGVSWNSYQHNGSDKEFIGNTHSDSIVKNNLPSSSRFRFIRFYPTARYSHPCLRVEIYGWRADG